MGSLISVQKVAAKKTGLSYEDYLIKIVAENWCSKCKSWKPKIDFGVDNSRGNGLSTKCYSCVRVKVKKSRKGRVSTFKGKHHTDKTKKLLSDQRKGNKSPMDGKKHSIEARVKISKMLRERGAKGKKCHSYKDGKMHERRGLRFTNNYKRWRFDVFARDKFTCQKCGDKKGGNLNAHHIKHFADHPEFRFELSNGITLCERCHRQEH